MSDTRILRGPSPARETVYDLHGKGVVSIVNLQIEDTRQKELIERLGMKFFHIPIVDHTAPTVEQIEEFIEIALEEDNLPLYVHCFAGFERTGTMIASYRIYDGWHCEDAIDYNYREVRWPLMDCQKEIVREYARKLETEREETL